MKMMTRMTTLASAIDLTQLHAISGVYAITPDCTDTADLLRRARQALIGGIGVLQYRNKTASLTLHREQALALCKLAHEFSVPFIVNDDVLLAAHVGADGVHLGAGDGGVAEARAVLGANKIIGISCYNRLPAAINAARAGADYVAFGAFYASSTKPHAVMASKEILSLARAQLTVPIVAIGGITLSNGAPLVQAGADALAVISALFDAPDICATAQKFSDLFPTPV